MTKSEISALPAEDAEQLHLLDEIQHGEEYDHFQHGDFPRCCGEHSQPITIAFCTMPEEAGR